MPFVSDRMRAAFKQYSTPLSSGCPVCKVAKFKWILKEQFCGSMKSQISYRVNVPILPFTLKRNYVCIFMVELREI